MENSSSEASKSIDQIGQFEGAMLCDDLFAGSKVARIVVKFWGTMVVDSMRSEGSGSVLKFNEIHFKISETGNTIDETGTRKWKIMSCSEFSEILHRENKSPGL